MHDVSLYVREMYEWGNKWNEINNRVWMEELAFET